MKTISATVSGTASIRSRYYTHYRTLAGLLALFLAATFAAGYGKDAKDEAKPASGETVLDESRTEHEDYKKGIAAFEKKDFAEAVKLFRAGAEKGDTDAMVMLAYCLENAKGVKKDRNESRKWYKKAADAGNALAQAMYGANLLEGDSEKEGIAYLKKSAAQDCIIGQYILGMHFLMDSDSKLLKVEGVKLL